LPIPRLQDEAAGAVFAIEAFFFFFEDAENLAGEVGTIDFFESEDVAELVAGETAGACAKGVEFGVNAGVAFGVPFEGLDFGGD
jgi:hypothetical protein